MSSLEPWDTAGTCQETSSNTHAAIASSLATVAAQASYCSRQARPAAQQHLPRDHRGPDQLSCRTQGSLFRHRLLPGCRPRPLVRSLLNCTAYQIAWRRHGSVITSELTMVRPQLSCHLRPASFRCHAHPVSPATGFTAVEAHTTPTADSLVPAITLARWHTEIVWPATRQQRSAAHIPLLFAPLSAGSIPFVI